ncbi:MAG: CBS domain-containing protein [Actinomycetota bacterium]|nr:CBS domain-containing protein [Actinomycetota bacterium]
MTLKDLLKAKPGKIVTSSPDQLLSDVVKTMDVENVGSMLIVDDKGKPKGIFTERDIMHCFAKGVAFKSTNISEVMTKEVVTLDASTDISVAVTLMSERKIRHLPVIEDDKVAGIVSYRDLVSYMLPEVIFMAEDIY